ncbi:uncharacterized protein METZ01_LOCUS438140 [marine metagenome]|uniref:Uncharacterized protein n=1 Tax=marine metagenome TaxID=408172 RepID=A0A382YPQ9_9ZZZZ
MFVSVYCIGHICSLSLTTFKAIISKNSIKTTNLF